MSLTTGFILCDDDTSIGLTLTEIAVIVAEWDAGPDPWGILRKPVTLPSEHGSDFAPLVISWMTYKAAGPGLILERGDVRFFLCEPEDIAEMRAVLAGQVAS
jgi:hypothetical protein